MNIKLTHAGDKAFDVQTAKSQFRIVPQQISPIEYFAAGIISCTGVDIVSMAEKNGVELKSLELDGDIVRNESAPMKFNEMLITYKLKCDADAQTVRRWVLSSIETYCSTINTIRDSVKMLYSIELNGELIVCAEEIKPIFIPKDIEVGIGGGACCAG